MIFTPQDASVFHCPRYQELPDIPLYMDQVLLVLESALCLFADEKERIVTPAMINNYVKQKFINAPEKKKYNRQHLAVLIMVSLLKKVFSMNEISGMIRMLIDAYGLEAAYDRFCDQLEKALRQAFGTGPEPLHISPEGIAAELALNASIVTFVSKLLTQSCLNGA